MPVVYIPGTVIELGVAVKGLRGKDGKVVAHSRSDDKEVEDLMRSAVVREVAMSEISLWKASSVDESANDVHAARSEDVVKGYSATEDVEAVHVKGMDNREDRG